MGAIAEEAPPSSEPEAKATAEPEITYRQYQDESDLPLLKRLIDEELVEPYSIFTFRMFVNPWPKLCHFCYVDGDPVGVVVCKIDQHKSGRRRGYLGMITVKPQQRRLGIGRCLAKLAIEEMLAEGVDEVALECETSNVAAQRLYQKLGFIRDKVLRRYYYTGTDAFRLKLRVK